MLYEIFCVRLVNSFDRSIMVSALKGVKWSQHNKLFLIINLICIFLQVSDTGSNEYMVIRA